jgi:hypothetical protein
MSNMNCSAKKKHVVVPLSEVGLTTVEWLRSKNQYGEPVALRVQSMPNKKHNLSFKSLFVYPSLP